MDILGFFQHVSLDARTQLLKCLGLGGAGGGDGRLL